MEKDRRAYAVDFGFDFQINAAIILMLENIDNLASLRLEGDSEDITIFLNNGKCILAQAKSVVRASEDTQNVRRNLKKALLTLSEGAQKTKAEKLIFITNSLDPFNNKDTKNIFYGYTRRSFKDLPQSAQSIIESYTQDIENALDLETFWMHVLPFETDDAQERYKVVKEKIEDFIGRLNLNYPGLSTKLMGIWQNDIFYNSTCKDSTIELKKENIIWPVIVIITDIDRYSSDLDTYFDSSQYDEILYRYHELIDSCCERCEFFIKVLYDYNNFKMDGVNAKEKSKQFALTKWEDYLDELSDEHIDSETQRNLVIAILYSIVRNRIEIDKIKKGVHL